MPTLSVRSWPELVTLNDVDLSKTNAPGPAASYRPIDGD